MTNENAIDKEGTYMIKKVKHNENGKIHVLETIPNKGSILFACFKTSFIEISIMYTVNRCKTLMGYILYVSLFTVVIVFRQ